MDDRFDCSQFLDLHAGLGRTTGWGILTGMVVGVVTAVTWRQFPELQKQVDNLVPAFAFSFIRIVVVSLITSNNGRLVK